MSERGSPGYLNEYNNVDEQFALNVVASISTRIADLNMVENDKLCKAALAGSATPMVGTDAQKHTKKKEARVATTDFFQRALTVTQARNHALRFGTGAAAVTNHRASWNFFPTMTSTATTTAVDASVGNAGAGTGNAGGWESGKRDYEDVVDLETLNAPICDVCIVQAKTLPPNDFYRMHITPSHKKADMNTASGGNPLYLCVRKDLTGTLAPITNFIVVFPDRNEYTPPGFVVVNRGKTACNLNSGTSAERIFLCYKKDSNGNPITDVQIILPTKGETPPAGFNIIEKSISGVAANLNAGTGGQDVYFCYKQHMARLNCLLTDPVATEEEAINIQSRLRLRRHTMRSFDDAEHSATGSSNDLLAAAGGTGIGGAGSMGVSSVAQSMQPVAINTLPGAGQNAAMRGRAVTLHNAIIPNRASTMDTRALNLVTADMKKSTSLPGPATAGNSKTSASQAAAQAPDAANAPPLVPAVGGGGGGATGTGAVLPATQAQTQTSANHGHVRAQSQSSMSQIVGAVFSLGSLSIAPYPKGKNKVAAAVPPPPPVQESSSVESSPASSNNHKTSASAASTTENDTASNSSAAGAGTAAAAIGGSTSHNSNNISNNKFNVSFNESVNSSHSPNSNSINTPASTVSVHPFEFNEPNLSPLNGK